MSALRQALADYLAVRRSLGYKLDHPEKLLTQFISWLETAGRRRSLTEHAVAWATLPGGDPSWHAYRLSVMRIQRPSCTPSSPRLRFRPRA